MYNRGTSVKNLCLFVMQKVEYIERWDITDADFPLIDFSYGRDC